MKNTLKNKRKKLKLTTLGFTLIELLAVIVILAIIALIATPIVFNIINNVKEEASKRSIDNIVHIAQLYYSQEKMKNPDTPNIIYISDIKDKIKGEIPESGYISINENGEVMFFLNFENKNYTKTYDGETKEEQDTFYIKVATTTNGADQPFLEGPILKEQIEKVITVPTNEVPSDVLGYWDVTDITNQEQTGKVTAWYYDKDNNGLYEVYIGQEIIVKANPDSAKLFNYLINVTEIDLTYFDTSNVANMWCLFQQCQKLQRIIGLQNFNTSKVTTMRYMFNFCFKLETLNLKNFNTSEVTTMYGMFQNCVSLTELDVSSFDTSKVENIGLMFAGSKVDDVMCYMNLERIIGIENFNTSSITNMQGMFQHCSSLTTLDLKNWNTSKVTDMSYMFSGCSGLTSVYLRNWDTSNVSNTKQMFCNCSSLTELDLRNWDTNNVDNMSNMFYGTINLKPIYIGEKWKTATTVTSMFGGDALTTSVGEMCSPTSTHSYCTLN